MEQYENLVLEYLNQGINEEKEVPVLEIDENIVGVKLHILTFKDVTLLRGVTGCGKTQVCAYLIKQLTLNSPDPFFKRVNNDKPFLVYVFETEMSKYSVKKNYIINAFPDFSKDQLKDELNIADRLTVISLKKYSMEDRKTKLIEEAQKLNKLSDSHNIVILIDNIGSFCPDLNAGQSNKLVNEIFSALSEFTTFIVMHTNHKENSATKSNATGLVGSVVERLSQNIVEISKTQSGIISMKLVKSKTQDDKLSNVVNFIQNETDEKFYIDNVVAFTDSSNYVQTKSKNSSRVSSSEFEETIKKHIMGKPYESQDRVIKNLKLLFPQYNVTSKSVDNKITELERIGILTNQGGYVFHKDEMPF